MLFRSSTLSAGLAGAQKGGIKGRNTAATIVRPGARASKTAALSALTAKSSAAATKVEERTSASPAVQDDGPLSKRNPVRKALKIPRAPPLDFSTIRTSAPRYPNPPPRPPGKPTRIFGLENAPVYHPSIDEFAKPMEYIEKIAQEAKEIGRAHV